MAFKSAYETGKIVAREEIELGHFTDQKDMTTIRVKYLNPYKGDKARADFEEGFANWIVTALKHGWVTEPVTLGQQAETPESQQQEENTAMNTQEIAQTFQSRGYVAVIVDGRCHAVKPEYIQQNGTICPEALYVFSLGLDAPTLEEDFTSYRLNRILAYVESELQRVNHHGYPLLHGDQYQILPSQDTTIEQADTLVELVGMTEQVEDYELNELGHVYSLINGGSLVVTSPNRCYTVYSAQG